MFSLETAGKLDSFNHENNSSSQKQPIATSSAQTEEQGNSAPKPLYALRALLGNQWRKAPKKSQKDTISGVIDR
jgi:hypothetical protein